jgi:hypothetical protein
VTVQLTRESADEANPAKKTHDRGGVRPCGSRSVPESRTAATQRRRLDGLRVGGNGLASRLAAGRQATAGEPAQRSGSAAAGRCQPAGRKMHRRGLPRGRDALRSADPAAQLLSRSGRPERTLPACDGRRAFADWAAASVW